MASEPLIFQFDDVRVDTRNAQIFKAGKAASVEPKAFQVLVYLLENRGRLIEKDELLSAIWPDTFVTENALTREIALLRKVLGDSKADGKYIETVPTRGYRFIAEVSVEAAASVSSGARNGREAPKNHPVRTGRAGGFPEPAQVILKNSPESGSYFSFAYSALASRRMGISGSASFQSVKKSW